METVDNPLKSVDNSISVMGTKGVSPSQERILDVLADGGWHGLEDFRGDYRKRISELRRMGYEIEDRWRTRQLYETKLYTAKDYRWTGGVR